MLKLFRRLLAAATVFAFMEASLLLRAADDTCVDWFTTSKLKAGPQCVQKCTALGIGMDTFFCPQWCNELCEQTLCGKSEHWVKPYHQRAYRKGSGILVAAKDVLGHCTKNTSTYMAWKDRLRDGKPMNWMHKSENASSWANEDRERVLNALSEMPLLLQNRKLYGIYRMEKSDFPGIPASNNYSDVVLYNEAFNENQNLTRILSHELIHGLYEDLPNEEKISFQKVGKWNQDSKPRATRPEDQFLRKNDMLSPIEDFVDSMVTYIYEPEMLKKVYRPIYDWMDRHNGSELKKR